jgi:enoyl-CoA hydratase/carnithine racemase
MEQIQVTKEGHLLLIKLNRPEKYNALSPAMYHAMGRALALLNSDPELRVAVLHAEGKHFTTGVELDLWAPLLSSGNPFPVQQDEIDPLGLTGPRHKKPLIVAVQGYCFTWGVEVLMNSEIRIAASDTIFQLQEVQRGIYPCAGAPIRLPREIGWGNAHKLMLTGDPWSAEEAFRWGMVQDIVEPGAQLAKALEYARKIACCAPLGVQGVMKCTRTAEALDHDIAVRQMFMDLIPIMQSQDAAEGIRSFVERRKAVFQGR